MNATLSSRFPFPSQLALVLLASAIAIPAIAQDAPPVSADEQSSPVARPSAKTPHEGFWGRINPMARKKWVNNRVEPLKGQLNELDEVNTRNGRDIRDVDGRAQAGIHRAQSAADAANQTASAAGTQAQRAHEDALKASGHVDQLNTTVSGLDQYHQASELEVRFAGGQPTLSASARKQLDTFAADLTSHQGYILEIEGHSPLASTAGIQSSARLADAVKRYFVTQHQIPVYRLHSLALGNAPATDVEDAKPAKSSNVRVRLMENSLAARKVTSTQNVAFSAGEERP
jgi:outer membrane protein OmpA-like peptidoglycan-associated protein